MQTTLFGFKNSKLIDLTQLYVSADAKWDENERYVIFKNFWYCLFFYWAQLVLYHWSSINVQGRWGTNHTFSVSFIWFYFIHVKRVI